jgi:hypothetical protein
MNYVVLSLASCMTAAPVVRIGPEAGATIRCPFGPSSATRGGPLTLRADDLGRQTAIQLEASCVVDPATALVPDSRSTGGGLKRTEITSRERLDLGEPQGGEHRWIPVDPGADPYPEDLHAGSVTHAHLSVAVEIECLFVEPTVDGPFKADDIGVELNVASRADVPVGHVLQVGMRDRDRYEAEAAIGAQGRRTAVWECEGEVAIDRRDRVSSNVGPAVMVTPGCPFSRRDR